MIARRTGLIALGALVIAPLAQAASGKPRVEVWKDPDCGCCKDWVAHLEKSGFDVRVNESGNEAARRKLGIPAALGSCHTGLVEGYALEGHVPAREIKRLLKEKPKAIGLAVPGMPVGSPGMDGAVYGGRKDPFDVLLVSAAAAPTVYQAYR
jgi:hypothetical protein